MLIYLFTDRDQHSINPQLNSVVVVAVHVDDADEKQTQAHHTQLPHHPVHPFHPHDWQCCPHTSAIFTLIWSRFVTWSFFSRTKNFSSLLQSWTKIWGQEWGNSVLMLLLLNVTIVSLSTLHSAGESRKEMWQVEEMFWFFSQCSSMFSHWFFTCGTLRQDVGELVYPVVVVVMHFRSYVPNWQVNGKRDFVFGNGVLSNQKRFVSESSKEASSFCTWGVKRYLWRHHQKTQAFPRRNSHSYFDLIGSIPALPHFNSGAVRQVHQKIKEAVRI